MGRICRTTRSLYTVALLLTIFGTVLGAELSGLRVWTSKKGSRVQASLVKVEKSVALFRKQDGRHLRIKVDQLSAKDQAFIRKAISTRVRKVTAPMKNESYPAWASSIKILPPRDKPWVVFSDSSRGSVAMKRNTGKLRYVVEEVGKSANYPFYLLQLGRHLTDLNADGPAYRMLDRLVRLPANTPHNTELRWYPDLDAVKKDAHLLMARLLARDERRDEAMAQLALAKPRTGYGALRAGEIAVMLDDRKKAIRYLSRARGNGHQEERFSDIFIRMRAVTLAMALGDAELARRIAEPVLREGRDSQKWPQWISALMIISKAVENGKSGRPSGGEAVKDGIWSGSCRGFNGPIDVDVRTRSGRMQSITVTSQKESRPWSALETVAARIVARQHLRVDAVTGATVSSCAIIIAVDDALTKADGSSSR